ncbi:asparagine synthase-related protein [Spirillospora sp. NPDC050679]
MPGGGQRLLYRNDTTGRVSADPLELIEGTPRFSLRRLAVNFDNPFLEAEFPPACPWEGISRVETTVEAPPPGSSSLADLRDAFRAATRACIDDAETVAVMYSGGLDSTSVLVAADEICRSTGRRLVAVVWNMPDQFGVPTGQLAHRQLKAMDLRCELRILPFAWADLPEPEWSPEGIRFDYYTRMHRAMIELVAAESAEVLLTGVGGDEVLASWQFMTPDLVRSRRWRDLFGYHRGFALDDPLAERVGELLAFASGRMSPARRFDLYSAFAYMRQFTPLPRSIVAEEYRDAAREAAQEWQRRRFARFEADRQTWAQAALWDSVYPLAHMAHPAGSPVREVSPFLEPSFIRFALGLPVVERFRYRDAPPYHWYKTLHFRLLPEEYRGVAPKYKQDYYPIFRDYELGTCPEDRLLSVELGLLDRVDKRDMDQIHPRLLAVQRNVEEWIRGALAAGAVPC